MVSVRANVSSSSPSYHYGSSPVSLSCLLEQPHNQCVPSSPSLSPFFRHAALSQKLLSRSSGSPAAAQVPDSTERAGMTASQGTLGSGNRVYSGSPLLRQILRGTKLLRLKIYHKVCACHHCAVGRKRQFEGEGGSPLRVSASTTPSPIAQSSKRAKLESPGMCVPSSVIIIERNSTRRKPRGMCVYYTPK